MSQQAESINDIAKILLSRFDLVRSLGRSGPAHLFLAYDRSPERISSLGRCDQVILKLLSTEAAGDPAQADLFRLEAHAAAKLSHSNIVNSSEAYGVGGLHLCVIEHKSDVETLRRRLDRNAWLKIDDALSIMYDLASALEYAHRNGVLHLNISPENVLLDARGVAFVSQFGIEADLGLEWAHSRRSRDTSAQYQSPEQALGAPLDCRSDLYSAGVLLFEMLTDRTPFNAEDAEAIRHKQLARQAPSTQVFRPDVPSSLSELTRRLLEKSPGDRFQSAGEMLSALKEVIDRIKVSAAVQPSRLQSPSAHDGMASILDLPASSSGDRISKPAPSDRELIPDDIDLVGMVCDGEQKLDTDAESVNVLDLPSEVEDAASDQRSDHPTDEKAAQSVSDGPPRRDCFEPPAVEAIAPGVLLPHFVGSGIRNPSEYSDHPPVKAMDRSDKTALRSIPASRARLLVPLVTAALCLLVLANTSSVVKIFKPSISNSDYKNYKEDTVGKSAEDSVVALPEAGGESPSSSENLQPGQDNAPQVGQHRAERRKPKLRRSDRSRWRRIDKRIGLVRRGRR